MKWILTHKGAWEDLKLEAILKGDRGFIQQSKSHMTGCSTSLIEDEITGEDIFPLFIKALLKSEGSKGGGVFSLSLLPFRREEKIRKRAFIEP